MNDDTESARHERARHAAEDRIRRRRQVINQVAIYVIINAGLWVIWLLGDSSRSGVPWPLYVTAGWGAILALVAWRTLSDGPPTEADIEREIRKIDPGA